MNPATPIWMPPLSFANIVTAVCIVAATQADKLPATVPQILLHPVGFILTVLIAISLYEYNSIPLAVSLILVLLSVWAAHHTVPKVPASSEGFLPFVPSGTIDWVNDDKQKWFVERVLRETPMGIQDKNIATYPVQTESSSSNA
jgi:hypothetical protein